MNDLIPPTQNALREALALSEQIIRNIELGEIPLAAAALKSSRLARLLNDFSVQRIMEFEVSGYPSHANGLPTELWSLAVAAGRKYEQKEKDEVKNYVFTGSIESLERELLSLDAALAAARDPDVALSSANPHQHVFSPTGNKFERDSIRRRAATAQQHLSSRRSYIYSYALKRNHELKYSGIADDIFSRVRERVDSSIGAKIPDAVQRLTAVYENLQSENREDWSNAVHSCRRILQDLADAIYPPTSDKVVDVGGKPKTIKLGADNYVNRIIAFLEDHSSSGRFKEIVGSHLEYMGERLDSVFHAAQKGSHDTIVEKAEADRYVVYTYLIVGDVLSLA